MRALRVGLGVLVLASFAFAGCDCGGGTQPGACTTTRDCPSGQACVDRRCTAATDAGPGGMVDTGAPFDAGPPPCTADIDCSPTGSCVAGACCALGHACGTNSCCADGQTCFASACVVPGVECISDADCAAGQYCEPGLATGGPVDAGAPDAGTRACLGGTPPPGRCLALPPPCTTDPPPPGELCIHACEYRPPAGVLDAVPEWHWGQDAVREYPGRIDVWSTPAVGRVADTNCDGVVDAHDPPNVVFVSGNAQATCCQCTATGNACITGALRVLDGGSGLEVFTVRQVDATSVGFAGVSVALGNADADPGMEIFAVTGEGRIALIDNDGTVLAVGPVIPGSGAAAFGWGGGLALADMDGDGTIEIAYGRALYRWDGTAITQVWVGTGGIGAAINTALSFFVDLDGMPGLELLAGRTAYRADGTILWNRTDLADGFSAVGDFDHDGVPEVAFVAAVTFHVLDGVTGATELGPTPSGGTGSGGPPTIADFDGDGFPEIGMASQNFYVVANPDYAAGTMTILWQTPNHDLSSSVTGSTVFDFEGDGAAEVIYNDECFLWVFNGTDGSVRFATPTTSFTATESSLVADVDGDGSAEIVVIANGADPSTAGWGCIRAPWTSPDGVRPAWTAPAGHPAYRGITVYGDRTGSWVGTRMLWNQHAYSVTNICDDGDDGCVPPMPYGTIPASQVANWSLPWLDNFRQNVQQSGLFDAPDAIVSLEVSCDSPFMMTASVRNVGAAILPAGVVVGFYQRGAPDVMLGTATTTNPLFPGQVAQVRLAAPAGLPTDTVFYAQIELADATRTFHECDETNDRSEDVTPRCLM